MKEKLLELLACPFCGGDILLAYASKYEDREIIEAVLTCRKCEREYKVTGGVPRFAPSVKIEQNKTEISTKFNSGQKSFIQKDNKRAEHFLGLIEPVKPEFFRDKIVLDVDCGKGDCTAFAANWGAKDVIGIDLSETVEAAFQSTKSLPNAHIVQGDVYKLPFKKVFDYAFSTDLSHYSHDAKKSFLSLVSKVKKGGFFSASIYAAENNEWLTNYASPLRIKFTSRFSQPTLYKISKLPAFGVFLASKLIYKPLNVVSKPLGRHLFQNDYFNHLSSFNWSEQHKIVFDRLIAPKAFYISRAEFENWWKEIDAQNVQIICYNKNSWSGFGQVK